MFVLTGKAEKTSALSCACVQTTQYPHLSLSENGIEMSLYLMGDMKLVLSDHPLIIKRTAVYI